ncbi:MAG: outer membrane protein assembly factor BamD [Pseudomonadota bacterium]
MTRKACIAAGAAAVLLLSGCSAIPFSDRFLKDVDGGADQASSTNGSLNIENLPEVPADKLLNAGIRNVNTNNHKKAQAAFDEIAKQHPFSREAQQSLVLSAFSHFEEGQYDDTVSKARRFLQLYPGSDEAAYMQYLIGESYYNQVSAVTLDQSDTEKGLRAYRDLLRLYPESKYSEDAKSKVVFMSDQLAGKEMQIGRYYQEKRQHLAAVNRFRAVAENYQRTRHVEEALYRLTESYLSLGVVNEAQTAGALLGHNYPDSDWYRDAYNLLTGSNLKPKVSRGSRLLRFVPFTGGEDDNPEPPRQAVPVAQQPAISNLPNLALETPSVGTNSVPDASGVPGVPATTAASVPASPAPSVVAPAPASVVPAAPQPALAQTAPPPVDGIQPGTAGPILVEEREKKRGLRRFVPFVGGKKSDDS